MSSLSIEAQRNPGLAFSFFTSHIKNHQSSIINRYSKLLEVSIDTFDPKSSEQTLSRTQELNRLKQRLTIDGQHSKVIGLPILSLRQRPDRS